MGISRAALAVHYGQDVVFAHDDVLFAFELDLVTGVLAEEDAVTRFEADGADAAVIHPFA